MKTSLLHFNVVVSQQKLGNAIIISDELIVISRECRLQNWTISGYCGKENEQLNDSNQGI